MNKWQKIIADIPNEDQQNNNQRFWHLISLLRLKKIKEANELFIRTHSQFKRELRFRLIEAELFIVFQKYSQAIVLLEDTFTSAFENEQNQKSWFYLVKRLPHSSEKLKSFMNRIKENHQDLSIPQGTTHEEWSKMSHLKEYHKEFSFYFAWLQWQKNQFNQAELLKVLDLILKHCSLNSYQHYLIFKELQDANLWNYMIENLFPAATQISDNKEKLWRFWSNTCPNQYKKDLIKIMSKYILKKPNLVLEDILVNLQSSTNQTLN